MNDPIAPDRIGRFTRPELEAMRGKRGRKPPEYFEAFPELKKEAPAAPSAPRRSSVKLSATAPVCEEPGVAYLATHADPLAARVAQAPEAARALISGLLDLLGVPAGAAARHPAPAIAGDSPSPARDAVGEGESAEAAAGTASFGGKPLAIRGTVGPRDGIDGDEPRADPVYADPEAEDVAVGMAG